MVIPPNKPYITLQGAGRNVSIIEWQDVAGDDNIRDIYKYQIQPYATTASVSVFASYFTARNISFRVRKLTLITSLGDDQYFFTRFMC